MKWKVEFITEISSNILVDDHAKLDIDKEIVGVGFPLKLAERIVKMHNENMGEEVAKRAQADEDYKSIWNEAAHCKGLVKELEQKLSEVSYKAGAAAGLLTKHMSENNNLLKNVHTLLLEIYPIIKKENEQ